MFLWIILCYPSEYWLWKFTTLLILYWNIFMCIYELCYIFHQNIKCCWCWSLALLPSRPTLTSSLLWKPQVSHQILFTQECNFTWLHINRKYNIVGPLYLLEIRCDLKLLMVIAVHWLAYLSHIGPNPPWLITFIISSCDILALSANC
jgi:hypothetical protein